MQMINIQHVFAWQTVRGCSGGMSCDWLLMRRRGRIDINGPRWKERRRREGGTERGRMDRWLNEWMNGWMDRWGLGGWREVCYILASIHRRAHQRQSDIYGAADCASLLSAAGTESCDIVSCAGRAVTALDYCWAIDTFSIDLQVKGWGVLLAVEGDILVLYPRRI